MAYAEGFSTLTLQTEGVCRHFWSCCYGDPILTKNGGIGGIRNVDPVTWWFYCFGGKIGVWLFSKSWERSDRHSIFQAFKFFHMFARTKLPCGFRMASSFWVSKAFLNWKASNMWNLEYCSWWLLWRIKHDVLAIIGSIEWVPDTSIVGRGQRYYPCHWAQCRPSWPFLWSLLNWQCCWRSKRSRTHVKSFKVLRLNSKS